MESITIRPGTSRDADAIRALYVATATPNGGLARTRDEITVDYIRDFIADSMTDGVLLVAELAGGSALAGELHAYSNRLRRFAHVLGSLTVAVHPAAQGRGVGRLLFSALFAHVRAHMPHIERIELITEERNVRALRLYESMGFRREGRFEQGILSPSGDFDADIPMAWLRSRIAAD